MNYLNLEKAVEHFNNNHGEMIDTNRFLKLAASGGLPVFAFVRKDVCVLDKPVPIGDDPSERDIQLAFDMGKRIVHEAGSHVQIDRHDTLTALNTGGTASIDSVFLDGMRHDIVGEPVLTRFGVFAPPTRWNISMDDLWIRIEDFDRLIKGSHGETAEVGDGDTAADAGKANKREIRIAAIVETAERMGYTLLNILWGGKKKIETECLDRMSGDPYRFTKETFKKAWQAACNAGKIKVEDSETYRGR